MEWLGALLVVFLAVVTIGNAQTCGNVEKSDACEWAATTNGKMYSFNLATPVRGYPHGILSEDGFYKVTAKTSEGETNYWFQLCEHMKFNFNPPLCENCEACGGPGHCGETCSALMSSSYPGYSVCTTLGYPGSIFYSLINHDKPDQGIRVKMTTCNNNPKPNCSFSVLVYCSHSGVELPTTVTNRTGEVCEYETILKHPAGCPVVTNVSKGGWGWFGSLLFMFLKPVDCHGRRLYRNSDIPWQSNLGCLLAAGTAGTEQLLLAFVVYMAVGIAYRVTVLGVSGFEAIPNLDTWRALPAKIKSFLEYIISQCMGIYYHFTEYSYSRVNT